MNSEAKVTDLGELLSDGAKHLIVQIQAAMQAHHGFTPDSIDVVMAMVEKICCEIGAEIMTQGRSGTASHAIQVKDGKLLIGNELRAQLFNKHVEIARESQRAIAELKRAHGVEDDEDGGDCGTH